MLDIIIEYHAHAAVVARVLQPPGPARRPADTTTGHSERIAAY